MLKGLRAFIATYWLPAALYGAVLLAFGWLLWWQLGSLTHGYSAGEANAVQASRSLHDIFNHPINAPFTAVAHGLMSLLPYDDLVVMRLTATLFGMLALTAFYWLVRYWHGQKAAVFGSVLFGTSAWFLHTARLGTPDVVLFSLLALTACSVWLKHGRQSLPVVLCLTLAAALLYVPGMIWFIIAGVVWQWKTIDRVFKANLWMVTVGGFLLLAILAPLALAIYHDHSLAKVVVGLPAEGWPAPFATLKHIAEIPLQIVARGPLMPEHWLGRMAILDAFCIAMLFLGAYAYLKHVKLVRAQLLGVILVIGTVLAGLGGQVTTSIVVPFVYIMVAAGVGLLLERWYAVFPRNQIAQTVGIGLVSLAVLASSWYGYRHYFVAWPHAGATRAVYSVPPSRTSDTIKK